MKWEVLAFSKEEGEGRWMVMKSQRAFYSCWTCGRGCTRGRHSHKIQRGSLAKIGHATGRKITAYAVYFPVDGASAGADARELQVWCGLKSRATDVERAINSYLYEDQELERLEEGLKKANLPRGDTAAQEQLVTALLKGVELLEPESEPVELEGTPAGTQSSQRASRCDCETSL
jgi:hypothetical protein